jgi:membrane-bound lytic murein transglycosylase B
MNKPYEKKPWSNYYQLFMTSKRINEGVAFWQQNADTLKKAEKKYGVPADIIVAVLGVETFYGRIQGNHKVLDALSTLAFNYPARSKFFKKELREYLILCRELNVNPDSVQGSYAGAIGKPQFMPSSYRAYAVNANGKGPSDLRADNQDVIYSIANYLKTHGWRDSEDVAVQASLTGKNYKKLKTNPRRATYSLSKLEKYGVKPKKAAKAKKAGLVVLDDLDKKEYWLGFNNFFVITRYNTSKQYATVVYLLAEELKRQKNSKNSATA